MSDTEGPKLQIATFYRAPDGRLVEVDILPDPDPSLGEDQVLVWDAETQRPRWVSPATLGFSPTPMILDVPMADGAGRRIVTGDGRRIVANKPSN